MSYQVLARKWRPKSFDTLVGQDHVVRALTNALEQNRLHHAYLFTGTRGVGKTTLARILAKALNCETGVTATPCGVCNSCVAIDEDRFIDYFEINAASTRGIDDVRSLLEQATYSPTQGRFKIYMLDEVHQLTKEAFNALLKTLEEPPSHVKFILGTTDPQKVPVTVLSRCLQFNLRQMTSSAIINHLQDILNKEEITYETPALHLIARAAAGSMRDALSLTDQAIAYGGNDVNEQEVRAMLGAVDQGYLFDLVQALIAQNGAAILQQAQMMEARSLSFEVALNDFAQLLHQIAVIQTVPESLANDDPEYTLLHKLADEISPETLQLYYQIAILGRRDIGLAPDEYAGFTMSLLRMLAFTPNQHNSKMPVAQVNTINEKPMIKNAAAALGSAITSKSVVTIDKEISTNAPSNVLDSASETATAEITKATQGIPHIQSDDNTKESTEEGNLNQQVQFDGNWRGLLDQLKLGTATTLALHCELVSFDAHNILLNVPETQKKLLIPQYQEKLANIISAHFHRKIKLRFNIGGTGNTPAQQINLEKTQAQSNAEDAIQNDGFVQALINDFGASIIPNSIKPIQ